MVSILAALKDSYTQAPNKAAHPQPIPIADSRADCDRISAGQFVPFTEVDLWKIQNI
jgi:hypothetical protein